MRIGDACDSFHYLHQKNGKDRVEITCQDKERFEAIAARFMADRMATGGELKIDKEHGTIVYEQGRPADFAEKGSRVGILVLLNREL